MSVVGDIDIPPGVHRQAIGLHEAVGEHNLSGRRRKDAIHRLELIDHAHQVVVDKKISFAVHRHADRCLGAAADGARQAAVMRGLRHGRQTEREDRGHGQQHPELS